MTEFEDSKLDSKLDGLSIDEKSELSHILTVPGSTLKIMVDELENVLQYKLDQTVKSIQNSSPSTEQKDTAFLDCIAKMKDEVDQYIELKKNGISKRLLIMRGENDKIYQLLRNSKETTIRLQKDLLSAQRDIDDIASKLGK